MILNEGLNLLIEELLDENAKTDFINKFGEDTFNKFERAKDRLKNNGHSTDYQQYLKMSEEELINFLASLYTKKGDEQKKRIIQGTDKEIRGKYKYLGEKNGYKVYQPLDYLASMDLGVNTGWCTTGRYEHYGHPEYTPSTEDAKKHWTSYIGKGIKFYYFLDPKTMYGKYAIALYPKTIEVNKGIADKTIKSFYLKSANFEIWSAEDQIDYTVIEKLPLDLIPEKLDLDIEYFDENGLLIKNDVVTKAAPNIESVVIPNGVKTIGENAFRGCADLVSVTMPDSVECIEFLGFGFCKKLHDIKLSNNLTTIDGYAFESCYDLESITLPEKLSSLAEYAFTFCVSLKSIHIPKDVIKIKKATFNSCMSLKKITFDPNSKLQIIEGAAFMGCRKLKHIKNLPKSLVYIDSDAFIYSDVESVTLPSKTCTVMPSLMATSIEINYPGTLDEWIAFMKEKACVKGYKRINCTNGFIHCKSGECFDAETGEVFDINKRIKE